MKGKLTLFLIFFLVISSYVSTPMADTGDTVQEAVIATLGDNPGTVESSSDDYWYNFTANPALTYNFTLDLDDDANLIVLLIYDQDQTLIDSKSGSGDKALNATGEPKYMIRVAATEFVNAFPANFTVNISIIRSSASLGDIFGSLDSYNDYEWFEFNGETSKKYKFSLDLENNTDYIKLYLYDQDISLLNKSTDGLGDRSLNSTGYSTYWILISSTEFVNEYPANFTLSISVIDPTVDDNNDDIVDDDEDNGNDQDSENDLLSELPFSIVSAIFVLTLIPLVRKSGIFNKSLK